MPSLVDPVALAELVVELRTAPLGSEPLAAELCFRAADAIEALEGTKNAWRACSRRWARRTREAEAAIASVKDFL